MFLINKLYLKYGGILTSKNTLIIDFSRTELIISMRDSRKDDVSTYQFKTSQCHNNISLITHKWQNTKPIYAKYIKLDCTQSSFLNIIPQVRYFINIL